MGGGRAVVEETVAPGSLAVAGRQDATSGRARRARAGRPLWGQLASPARVSGGGAQTRAPPPPPRRTGAGQRAEVVVGRRAEVEAGRCAGAGLPPGAGQCARARSRAEEGDGGGEEDGVAEVEAGRAPGQACRARRRGGGPQRGARRCATAAPTGPPLHVCVVSLRRRRNAFRIAEYPECVRGFGLPLEDGFGYLKHCVGRILCLGHILGG